MVTLNEILIAAQSLPSPDRARLIASLWDTTSPAEWVVPDASWVAEANRRSDAFEAGTETGLTWGEARV
jgi:putative addiction module component (TIGR02574 family)